MDDQTFAQDDGYDEPEDAAASLEDAEESPFDDDAPDETDQTDDAYRDSDEPPEEDPTAAVADLRRQIAERDERDRQRANEEATREAERQRTAREADERQRHDARVQANRTYWSEKQGLAGRRQQDAVAAAQASDPALMAQHLAQLRAQEERTIESKYAQWVERDRQAEVGALRAERDAAVTVQYADYVRGEYGLPHDELNSILRYADGTPVDPKAMSARAAELVERRKELATLKRQLKRQAKEDGRADMRGRTAAGPGRGRGAPPPKEFEGTIEELVTYFPWHQSRRA